MADTENSRRNMWRAVIQQAVADAISTSQAKQAIRDRADARAWFNGADRNFREVCAFADLEPSQVCREALAYIAEADQRVAAGLPSKQRKAKPTAPKKVTPRHSYQGEDLTLDQWSERMGIKSSTLRNRLSMGWSLERTLTEPVVIGGGFKNNPLGELAKRITFDGQTLTVQQWASRIGMSAPSLHHRLSAGWTIERALTTPKQRHGGRRSPPEPLPLAA